MNIFVSIRDGPVKDDKEDMKLNIWSGIIPLTTVVGKPIPTKNAIDLGISNDIPEHVLLFERNKFGRQIKREPILPTMNSYLFAKLIVFVSIVFAILLR